jgi:hypothetical protein
VETIHVLNKPSRLLAVTLMVPLPIQNWPLLGALLGTLLGPLLGTLLGTLLGPLLGPPKPTCCYVTSMEKSHDAVSDRNLRYPRNV